MPPVIIMPTLCRALGKECGLPAKAILGLFESRAWSQGAPGSSAWWQ
jgi:hypothetical protein